MTHRMSSSDACSLVIMSGIAMLTIVRSSRVMKNPSATTMRTTQGFPRYFCTLPSPCDCAAFMPGRWRAISLTSRSSDVSRNSPTPTACADTSPRPDEPPPGCNTVRLTLLPAEAAPQRRYSFPARRCNWRLPLPELMVETGTDKTPAQAPVSVWAAAVAAPNPLRAQRRPKYAPPMKLNGTSAIVSGGASGLGEAVVRSLAAAGVRVVVADLSEDKGKAVADDVGGVFARNDVADEQSVAAAVEAATAAAAEPLRTVVSCAGIGWAARTVGRDGSPHDLVSFREVIDVNLIGTFNLLRIGAAAIVRA